MTGVVAGVEGVVCVKEDKGVEVNVPCAADEGVTGMDLAS